MLVLTFQVAGMAYGVAAGRVVEVVPRVELRPLPHAPSHLVGLLRYRGGAVPVVDLGLLMGSRACRERLDTRIIVVRTTEDLEGADLGMLALVAERVEKVQRVDEAAKAVEGLGLPGAPYLGDAYRLDDGLLQMIEPWRISATSASEARAVAP